MARFGCSMYAPSQHCYVFVTVDGPGDAYKIVRWRSRTGVKAIRHAARKAYPNARLAFGVAVWITD